MRHVSTRACRDLSRVPYGFVDTASRTWPHPDSPTSTPDGGRRRCWAPLGDGTRPHLTRHRPARRRYTGGVKKIAEHGGATPEDRDVALVVSGAGVRHHVESSQVQTTQIAPTILHLLGLNPNALQRPAPSTRTSSRRDSGAAHHERRERRLRVDDLELMLQTDLGNLARAIGSASMARLLLVEDDAVIGRSLHERLVAHRYGRRLGDDRSRRRGRGRRGPVRPGVARPRSADVDGVDLCRRLRAALPASVLVIVTARDEEIDVVVGLEPAPTTT